MKRSILFIFCALIFSTAACDSGDSNQYFNFFYNDQQYKLAPSAGIDFGCPESGQTVRISYADYEAPIFYIFSLGALFEGEYTSDSRSISFQIKNDEGSLFTSTYCELKITSFKGRLLDGTFYATDGENTITDGKFRVELQDYTGCVQMNSSR